MRRCTRYDTDLGRRVSALLVKAQTNQYVLARLLGVPRPTLNQWLTGRMAPRAGLEQDIVRVLCHRLETVV